MPRLSSINDKNSFTEGVKEDVNDFETFFTIS